MASKDLNRYIKEVLKFEPRTLSMAQMEILIEYDAWLDEQRGLTPRAVDGAYADPVCACGLPLSQHGDVACEHRPATNA